MALFDFKGKAQAEAWKRDMSDLNERTDQILGQVYTCIDEIKTESSGDFVEQLVVTAADMADAVAEMIKAMKSINDLIDNVIKALAEFIGDAVQKVVDSRNAATNM